MLAEISERSDGSIQERLQALWEEDTKREEEISNKLWLTQQQWFDNYERDYGERSIMKTKPQKINTKTNNRQYGQRNQPTTNPRPYPKMTPRIPQNQTRNTYMTTSKRNTTPNEYSKPENQSRNRYMDQPEWFYTRGHEQNRGHNTNRRYQTPQNPHTAPMADGWTYIHRKEHKPYNNRQIINRNPLYPNEDGHPRWPYDHRQRHEPYKNLQEINRNPMYKKGKYNSENYYFLGRNHYDRTPNRITPIF